MKSYLLIGSNLGDREDMLRQAREKILKSMPILSSSKIYESEAWGPTAEGNFLNQLIVVETSLLPEELLGRLKAIESDLGRVRKERWADRIIDIDILYYEEKIVNRPTIQIPHSQIPNRRFVLAPLADLFPDFVNPLNGRTNQEMLLECRDEKKVWEYSPKP